MKRPPQTYGQAVEELRLAWRELGRAIWDLIYKTLFRITDRLYRVLSDMDQKRRRRP